MPRKTIFRAICAASRYIDGPELTWAHSGPQRWIWTLREKVRENSSGHVGGCRFRVYRVIEPLRTRCAWSCHLTRSWEREGEFLAPSLWFARCVTGCNSRSGVLECLCLGGDGARTIQKKIGLVTNLDLKTQNPIQTTWNVTTPKNRGVGVATHNAPRQRATPTRNGSSKFLVTFS